MSELPRINPDYLASLKDSEYRAITRESFSSIKYILDSPKIYQHYKNKPFTGSSATLLGTAIHHYLQGNKHLVAFSVIDKRKKEEYAKFQIEFMELAGEEGIIVPKSFEEKTAFIMKNLNENEVALRLLGNCQFEVPYLFDLGGIPLKGKVDGVYGQAQSDTPGYLLEIKTSSQATTALEFKEEAKERHYDMQAAMYLHAHDQKHMERLEHYFIVVNTIVPFKVAVYKSSREFIKGGEKKLNEALHKYKTYIINKEEYFEDAEEI